MKREFLCSGLHEINRAAKEVLEFSGDRRIVAFYGEMGVGKTTLIKEICNVLGSEDTVSSPTYSIVNEYAGPGNTIYHFDFYRIKNEEEALDMGYEEYFDSGSLCLIEWPEKISNLLPSGIVKVHLTAQGQKRHIVLQK
jgi:tRNA threonylcarbamoyladenosine biosynthesis protein TsaE